MESPFRAVPTNRDSTNFIIWEIANNGKLLGISVEGIIFLSVILNVSEFAALKPLAFGSCMYVCVLAGCVYIERLRR